MADVVNDWNRLEKQIRLIHTNDSSCISLKCRFEAPAASMAVPLWESFCRALETNTYLHTLDLSRNSTFGDKGCIALARALASNHTLRKLNLRATHMGAKGAVALVEKLYFNAALQELDVSDNPHINAEVGALLKAVRYHPTLEIVRICACNVKPEPPLLVELEELIKVNPRLIQLDLHHNYFHHEALRRYFTAIRESPHCRINKLDLDSMGVGIVAIKELVEVLNSMPNIRHVSLRKNVVGGPPIAYFFKTIRHNNSLSTLNLARSRLKESDIKLIGEYLRDTQPGLQELDISDNGLGTGAMTLICDFWGRNKSLTSLSLGQNDFSGDDISKFLSFVVRLNSWRDEFPFSSQHVSDTMPDHDQTPLLSTLDFMEMQVFQEKQVRDLAKILESSNSLSKVVLYNCRISETNTKILIEAIKNSSSLAVIDLRGNHATHEDLTDLANFYVTSPTLARVYMDFSDPKRLLRCKYLPKLGLRELPPTLLKATHLMKLTLKGNRLSILPAEISKLTELVTLDLRDNELEMLPPELGFLTNLKKLKLCGNPLRTPPQELRESAGHKAAKILGYLRDLHHGQELVYRVKLMFVGQENVGKTTLLSLLRKKYKSKSFKVNQNFKTTATIMRSKSGKLEQFLSTDGIDINEIQMEINMPIRPPGSKTSLLSNIGPATATLIRNSSNRANLVMSNTPAPRSPSAVPQPSGAGGAGGASGGTGKGSSSAQLSGASGGSFNSGHTHEKRTVTISTWDFGGQDIYYSTHQFFLSDHSIFLVVWDLRYEEEKSRVGFWLQSIQARTNSAAVIIVGTHSDDPSCADNVAQRKIESVRHKYRKYKMVKAVIGLSCLAGDLTDLIAALTSTIQELPIMGMSVPSSYMALSTFIRQYRQASDTQREEMMQSSRNAMAHTSAALPSVVTRAEPVAPNPVSVLKKVNPSIIFSAPSPVPSSTPTHGSGMVTGVSAADSFVGTSNLQIRAPRRASSSGALNAGQNSSPTVHRNQLIPVRSSDLSVVPYKTWAEFAEMAKFCHINDGPDLKRCAETLHLLGDIIYFDDPKAGLDDLVILDSQYLTHVMATIITTKQNYVKNGVLNYNDLRLIWTPPLFPLAVHPYLLAVLEKFEIVYTASDLLAKRLVEYFDVTLNPKNPTYPMTGLGVIPSLLPEAVPVLDLLWTKFDEKILQFDRQYIFDLIPSGLFSRLLVRLLHTSSEVMHCWRYGAVFLAGDSICLAELNSRRQCISVTVRGGTNPAEELRILTEVIEALILIDTWWKTNFRRQVSCVSCLHQLTSSPALYAASRDRSHNHTNGSKDLMASPRSISDGDDPQISSDSNKSTHVGSTSRSSMNQETVSQLSDGAAYDHKRSRSGSSHTANIDPLDPDAPYRRGSSINFRSSSMHDSLTPGAGVPQMTPSPKPRHSKHSLKSSRKGSSSGKQSPPASPRDSKAAAAPAAGTTDDSIVKSRRAPSLGQLRHHHHGHLHPPKGEGKPDKSPVLHKKSSRPTLDVSNGSFMSSTSQALGSPVSSSENLLWGSAANMEIEPCYFTIEECEKAASEGRAFLQCDAGHMVRLDRVAPDVALTDFEGNRIEFSELELIAPALGRGSFGEIYKANWGTRVVAVKRLLCDPIEIQRVYNIFRREVWIMSGLCHPNLVNLRGYCLEPAPMMVMEFVSGGDLYSFLHKEDKFIAQNRLPPRLDAALVLKIALDVASGIKFLHSATPPFIHRDLKSPNILLMENLDPYADIVAKVADFGLTSRMVIPLRKEGRAERAVVNPTWQAPEIMREEAFSEKSDTYAFGIILWELYTREHPYANVMSSFLYEVEEAVLSKQRPPIPDDCPEEYAKLIRSCWADNPDERPSFTEIIQAIYVMIDRSGYGGKIRASRTMNWDPNTPGSHRKSQTKSSASASASSSAELDVTAMVTASRSSPTNSRSRQRFPPVREAGSDRLDDSETSVGHLSSSGSTLSPASRRKRRLTKNSSQTGSSPHLKVTTAIHEDDEEGTQITVTTSEVSISQAAVASQASRAESLVRKKQKRRSAPSLTAKSRHGRDKKMMTINELDIGASDSMGGVTDGGTTDGVMTDSRELAMESSGSNTVISETTTTSLPVDISSSSRANLTTNTASERSEDSMTSSVGTTKNSLSDKSKSTSDGSGSLGTPVHIISPPALSGSNPTPSPNSPLTLKGITKPHSPHVKGHVRHNSPTIVTTTFAVGSPHQLRRAVDNTSPITGIETFDLSTSVTLTAMPSGDTTTADTDTFVGGGSSSARLFGKEAVGKSDSEDDTDLSTISKHSPTQSRSDDGDGSQPQRMPLLLSSTMSQEEETDSDGEFSSVEKHSFSSGEKDSEEMAKETHSTGGSDDSRELDYSASTRSYSFVRNSAGSDPSLLNPVFSGTSFALVGRFAKKIATRSEHRITTIFPVGNSQVWGTGRDGSVNVWNAKNGDLLSRYTDAHQGCIKSAAPVLDTVWMSCPKTKSVGVWHVKVPDTGSRVERRYGTINVGQLKDNSKIGHWRKRFVVINMKEGSLKLFPMKETKNTSSMFDMPTLTSAPIKELSLISTAAHHVNFGLAVEHNERSFKVTSGTTTLYFELEEVHDMLEWLDCIASIATGEQLVCLTRIKNEWTRNIGIMHAPSVKGEVLITGSNDAELEVVSWNVHTKRVICGTRLSTHLAKLSESQVTTDSKLASTTLSTALQAELKHHASAATSSNTASTSTSSSHQTTSATGENAEKSTEKTHEKSSHGHHSRKHSHKELKVTPSTSNVLTSSAKKLRISGIVTLPKMGYTLVSAGSFVFVLSTKSLEVVHMLRSHTSAITAMALTRPKEIWTAASDGTIIAWDASSFTQITQFKYPTHHRVKCIVPTTAHNVWTADDSGTLISWDSETHTIANILPQQHTSGITSIALWYHSLWACSRDKTVSIWT